MQNIYHIEWRHNKQQPQKQMIWKFKQILDTLVDNEIQVAAFHEPDLGDQLTGVVLIADERCFNHEDYPFFADWMKGRIDKILWLEYFKNGHENTEETTTYFKEQFEDWAKLIGGTRNVFLKYYLRTFRLV